MNRKIYLSSPHLGNSESKYILDAIESNWIAPIGENINGFEDSLEGYLSHDVQVAVLSSGTAAIHLALIQCGVTYGDEVICQSLTFSASANPIVYCGATPVFIDSEDETWNMSPFFLRKAIEDRISRGKFPKAIIIVHIYGMPAKIDDIVEIANEYKIPIIEDAAEALGSKYKQRACGTFGDFGILSFNGNKIITTSAGGALICHQKKQKDNTIFLATQAKDKAVYYEHSQIGYNYRMSNILAGIGLGQMEVLESRIHARRDTNNFYKELFRPYRYTTFLHEPSEDFYSNHWLSVILIDESSGKTNLKLLEVLEQENIESRLIWKPLHLQPVFRGFPFYGIDIAENFFKSGLCLPSGSNLLEADKERIKNVIYNYFNS